MDDLAIGARIRAVRIHKGWRQEDVARRAGVSRASVWRAEHGRLDELTIAAFRSITGALDVRADVNVRWHGGDLDRMVNARHAALHEAAARSFKMREGWAIAPEVTFSLYGERGTIDCLAWHAERHALLVIELKSEIVDVQGLLGAVDRYRRLAPRIAGQRGWVPSTISTWVAVAAGRANARAVAAHRAVLRGAFPADGRRLAVWLRGPEGRLDALTFLPYARGTSAGRDLDTPRRVRVRRVAGASR